MRILILRAYKEYGGFVQALDGCLHLPGVEVWQFGQWKGDKFGAMPPEHIMYSRHFSHQVIASEEEVVARLKRGEFDLIIGSAQARDLSLANLHPVPFLARLRFRRKFGSPGARERMTVGANFLGFWEEAIKDIPMLGIDTCDEHFIQPCDLPLFLKSRLYFKSNLPFNESNCFIERGFWQGHRYLDASEKLRPFSIGIGEDRFRNLRALRPARPDYRYDVFALFLVRNSIRKSSLEALKKLRETTGLRILMPEEKISAHEFYQYCTQSRVTLSPEGGGWECARHYEAIACGSLPFMNRPLLRNRWQGVLPEAVVYENDFSDFAAKLVQLVELSQRAALLEELTTLTEERFTWTALMRHALREAGYAAG